MTPAQLAGVVVLAVLLVGILILGLCRSAAIGDMPKQRDQDDERRAR